MNSVKVTVAPRILGHSKSTADNYATRRISTIRMKSRSKSFGGRSYLYKLINRSNSEYTVDILILTRYGRLGASSRMRALQFLPHLNDAGIVCSVQPLFPDQMLQAKYDTGGYRIRDVLNVYTRRLQHLRHGRQFDLVWIEKEALPWMPASLERILLRGVPYMLDFDDALFHNYDLHSSRLVRHLMGCRIDRLMAGARLVIAGNEYLAKRARDAGARWVEVLPTVIDLERYPIKPKQEGRKQIARIVWIGSPSTVQYLSTLGAPLAALARRVPFKLRVIGSTLDMPDVDVECVPWTEESEVASITQCDVGIMPLTDSPWERGKCGYKLIQYMACGLPVVASPVGVNTSIVLDGGNGFLAQEADAWEAKLGQLLEDETLRVKLGQAGRRDVETKYCVQRTAPKLVTMLMNAGRNKSCAAW
jgi:glycosyltransferase involved in cell wall biosynthesis